MANLGDKTQTRHTAGLKAKRPQPQHAAHRLADTDEGPARDPNSETSRSPPDNHRSENRIPRLSGFTRTTP